MDLVVEVNYEMSLPNFHYFRNWYIGSYLGIVVISINGVMNSKGQKRQGFKNCSLKNKETGAT